MHTQNNEFCWITDPHFDRMIRRDAFARDIGERAFKGIIITGDISNASNFEEDLLLFASKAQTPTYFVLGNHDYYFSDTQSVRELAQETAEKSEYLTYLDRQASAIVIDEKWHLVGVDSWADGGYGDPEKSRVWMYDWDYIEDIKNFDPDFRRHKLGRLALTAALRLRHAVLSVPKDEHLVIATHIPPYEQMLNGDDEYTPWYASKILGKIIDESLAGRTAKTVILTGHTHRATTYKRRGGADCFVGAPSADTYPASLVIAGTLHLQQSGDYLLKR